jgi:hypothetical protein
MWDSAEWGAVVYVSDRVGPALRRRERCLRLANIPYAVLTHGRPSGTYYNLCVREEDAISAHLALQMGGCCRSMSLRRRNEASVGGTLDAVSAAVRDGSAALWDRLVVAVGGLTDLLWTWAPRRLLAAFGMEEASAPRLPLGTERRARPVPRTDRGRGATVHSLAKQAPVAGR